MDALLAVLPFALLFLLCPLLMLFMHRGGADHHAGHTEERAQLARRLQDSKDEVRS